MHSLILLLAQSTQPAPSSPGLLFQYLPLLLMVVVFYFLLIRPRKTEQKKQKQLLDGLKKNDRVMTIGGVLGTVVSVKGDEVTLKVDESTNTKVTFIRSAIKSILSSSPGEEKPGS